MAEKIKNDVKRLSGSEKAAILFLCLGEQRGSNLMRRLEETEIFVITQAMAGLGTVASNVVEDVMTEYFEQMSSGSTLIGDVNAAEKILSQFMPQDKVQEMMEEVSGPLLGRNMWDRFSNLSENKIASHLKGENPQTIATILSKTNPEVSANVLPLLDKEQMDDVITRMIQMEPVPRDVLREIEETLETEFIASAAKATETDPHQRMADVFNKLDADVFEEISEKLDNEMPETFTAIKNKMFTFDDLVRMSGQDIGRIMRQVGDNVVAYALRNTKTPDIREYFLDTLTERRKNLLLDEMRTLGPVRAKDVQEAQSKLVDAAKELAEEGAVQLPSNDDDEILID